jgi:predicted porin
VKKSLVSALILSGLAGAASAQVSLYGLLDASLGKSILDDANKKSADLHSGGDDGSGQGNSTTRIGVKGSTDVGSGVKANFKFETAGITSDGRVGNAPSFIATKNGAGAVTDGSVASTPFFNRQAWMGFSSGLGEIRLGRQDSVPFQTMIAYDFNGASNGVSALGYANVGPWARDRQSRSIQYIAPTMGGLSVQLGAVPKGNVAGDKATMSAGATYALGAFSASAAFEGKRTTTGHSFWSLAASYDMGIVKFMAAAADGGPNATGVSFGAVAPFAGASVGFLYGRNNDTKGSGLEVFANKEVLKNTYAYAEIGRANSKAMTALGAPAGSAMGYALGVIYTF